MYTQGLTGGAFSICPGKPPKIFPPHLKKVLRTRMLLTRVIIQFVAPLIAALHHFFQLNKSVCYLSAKNNKGEFVEESQND